MAEWFVPAIISYEAIHNGFTRKDCNNNISSKKMVNYLESKILSLDSKKPIKKGYWRKKTIAKDKLKIVYQAIFNSEKQGNIFDVKNLHKRNLNDVDLLTYSFPCQDLSQQGKQKGMAKNSNSQSGLLWEIEKALIKTKISNLPKYLLMENVASLLNKNHKKDLKLWIKKLKTWGYKNDLQILNSGDFGSPQIRKRVFMLSSLKTKIKLPIGKKKPSTIKSILEKARQKDYMLSLNKYDLSKWNPKTKSNIRKKVLKNYTKFNSENYVYDPNYSGPTLTASGANSRIKIMWKQKIRKLNSQEAYKYMGFSKIDFNKVNNLKYLTETQMIYTLGNSISIEVLREIMKVIAKDNDE